MDTKPKSYKMLKTVLASRDGIKVETFIKDSIYHDIGPDLAEQLYHQGAIEEVTGKAASKNPADARETKVTGPSETKAPGETKEGEAGIDLGTQNIEELVALARDTYGLEVDSTMGEDELRKLIESAQEGSNDDSTAKKTKKGKK